MTTGLIDHLREGHRRFLDARLPEYRPLFENLVKRGQSPKALVIACSDSRVDPALLFDQDPGDLFIVRNVANVVPPFDPTDGYHGTSAAIEFAVKGLQVEDILVMGHAHCGGIQALIEADRGKPIESDFILPWMSLATPALRMVEQDEHTDGASHTQKCEQAVVRLSLTHLQTFPWINERVKDGLLDLHGLYFDIAAGHVHWLNPETDQFEDLAPKPAS